MAKFTIKALIFATLVCFVIDLAASEDNSHVQQQNYGHQESTVGYETGDNASTSTTPSSGTFKDKLKGFVNTVKEGAVDAYESVSDSVSGAKQKINEKSKEAIAGTKKLVDGAIQKIKNSYDSYKHGDSSEEVPRNSEESQSAEHAKNAAVNTKTENYQIPK